MRGERVVVTGASGFIGRALVRRLLAEGAAVTAFDRERPAGAGPGDAPHAAAFAEVDLRYASGLARAVRAADPTLVIHLAAVGVTDPYLPANQALRGNLDSTINLLKAVAGRCRTIVARTPHEREASSVYAASKAAAWAFCRMYQRAEGWPIVGVMPFQVYGPGQSARTLVTSAVNAARDGQSFPTTSGEQVRDWIYVDDVARGIVAAAGAEGVEGETIELGTGIGTPVREVVERIFQLVGRGRPLIGTLPARPGEERIQVADAARTERRTGWRAEVGLEEGLRRVVRAANGVAEEAHAGGVRDSTDG